MLKTMVSLFAVTLAGLTLGCEAETTALKPFEGMPGARFYGLPLDINHDGVLEQALTVDKYTVGKITSATDLNLSTALPIIDLQTECGEKLQPGEGESLEVHLINPETGTGAVWGTDGKITLKYEIRDESSAGLVHQGGRRGSGIRVTRRVGIVQHLTDAQMKSALEWFAANPCATMGQ